MSIEERKTRVDFATPSKKRPVEEVYRMYSGATEYDLKEMIKDIYSVLSDWDSDFSLELRKNYQGWEREDFEALLREYDEYYTPPESRVSFLDAVRSVVEKEETEREKEETEREKEERIGRENERKIRKEKREILLKEVIDLITEYDALRKEFDEYLGMKKGREYYAIAALLRGELFTPQGLIENLEAEIEKRKEKIRALPFLDRLPFGNNGSKQHRFVINHLKGLIRDILPFASQGEAMNEKWRKVYEQERRIVEVMKRLSDISYRMNKLKNEERVTNQDEVTGIINNFFNKNK